MSDWPIVSLGDYCSKIGSGATPRGGSGVYLDKGEICLIRSQNVYNEGFKPEGLVYITEDSADKLKNVIVEENDVLLNITGDSVARVCLAKAKYLPARVNQHVAIIRTEPNEFDARFIKYFLASSKTQKLLLAIASAGATRNALTKGMIESLSVPKPPIEIQIYIADNLSSLDKKIELNNQINLTLESMAQAIFKSWFVDFEPVKAKIAAIEAGEDAEGVTRAAMCAISGRADNELDQMQADQPENYTQLKTTAEQFPSAMQESELGDIPEGWEINPLDQIANFQNGLALQKFRPEDEDEYLPVLKIAQLKKGFADGEEKASVNIKPEFIVENGDVVFSWSGSLMVDIWCGGKVALNQHLFKVTSENYPKWFYYYWTKHHLSEFQRIAAAKAVTMGHIKREHLSSALCATPSSQIFENISKTIGCIIEKSIEVRLENFTLQNLRDSLLPKLLSGELSVDAVDLKEGK